MGATVVPGVGAVTAFVGLVGAEVSVV